MSKSMLLLNISLKVRLKFKCLLKNYKLFNEVYNGHSQRHSVLLTNKYMKHWCEMGQQMLKTFIAPQRKELHKLLTQ